MKSYISDTLCRHSRQLLLQEAVAVQGSLFSGNRLAPTIARKIYREQLNYHGKYSRC